MKREVNALEAAGEIGAARELRSAIGGKVGEYVKFSKDVNIRGKEERLWVCENGLTKKIDGVMLINEAPIHAIGEASMRNPRVINPETGDIFEYVSGKVPEYPQDHTMAGYKCKTGRKIDDVDRLMHEYNAPIDKWQKEKARYWVYDTDSEERQIELHWYQHQDVGKVEYKVKLGPNGEVYVDEW